MMHETDTTPETHELTFPGLVDPEPGTLMGPGKRMSFWQVVGTVHHPDGHSVVTIERAHEAERELRLELLRRQVVGRDALGRAA